jgi:hypothetical protein
MHRLFAQGERVSEIDGKISHKMGSNLQSLIGKTKNYSKIAIIPMTELAIYYWFGIV